MYSMPLIGMLAVLGFVAFATFLSFAVSSLKSRLASRQPCNRWFAFASGVVASMLAFSMWVGTYGLGATKPGTGGVLFGAFCGLIWGTFFSGIHSTILWHAFDSPSLKRDIKPALLETDLGLLFPKVKESILGFRFHPEFARTDCLPWALFAAAVLLPALWSIGFCLLTFLTEGAPGVEPVIPLD